MTNSTRRFILYFEMFASLLPRIQLHHDADKRKRGDVVLGLPQGAYGGTRERDVKIAAAWIAGFR